VRDRGTPLVEACVDSVAGALAAERAGAGRIELCAGLAEGGTTPSVGMLAATRARVSIPIVAMIRPRGGDFLHTEEELDVMARDVAAMRAAGADGVALGALTRVGAVDVEVVRALVEAAAPLPVTFHRAFDLAADLDAALDALVACGVRRVLTSGAAPRAIHGAATIARLVARAEDRLVVMAGGGIDAAAAAAIVRDTGVRELHVGGLVEAPSGMLFRRQGIRFTRVTARDEYTRLRYDEARLRGVMDTLNSGARGTAVAGDDRG